MNRRDFIRLSALFPVMANAGFCREAAAEPVAGPMPEKFVQVVRVLCGQMELPVALIEHVRNVVSAKDPSFQQRSIKLVNNIATPIIEKRNDIIRDLADDDVKTVTEIITPLYLGYTGTPANLKAEDSAQFVTFLHALMYEPTRDNLIRPSYSQQETNYWTSVPNGVSAPLMAENILEWGNRGPIASSTGYATPDPRYLVMCQGHARSVGEAEAYLASAKDRE